MTIPSIAPGEKNGCLFRCAVGKVCKGKLLVTGCESREQPGVCNPCADAGYEMLKNESTFRGLRSVMAH